MKIKLYREKMNLSQIEAAAQLGVSKDVYNSWEYEIRIPRAKQMRKIYEWSGGLVIVSMSLDLAPVILGISKDKYFGDLPKGLNASSEGTNRIYYDKIQSLNEKICYDNVEKVLKILQLMKCWTSVTMTIYLLTGKYAFADQSIQPGFCKRYLARCVG